MAPLGHGRPACLTLHGPLCGLMTPPPASPVLASAAPESAVRVLDASDDPPCPVTARLAKLGILHRNVLAIRERREGIGQSTRGASNPRAAGHTGRNR